MHVFPTEDLNSRKHENPIPGREGEKGEHQSSLSITSFPSLFREFFSFFFNILPKNGGKLYIIILIFICKFNKRSLLRQKVPLPRCYVPKLFRNKFVKIFWTIFFCIQCFKILVQCLTGTIRSVMDILNIVPFM